MNKRYVVTIEIRDGDYEYFSISQHQLDPEEMDKAEDRDAYILKDVFVPTYSLNEPVLALLNLTISLK